MRVCRAFSSRCKGPTLPASAPPHRLLPGPAYRPLFLSPLPRNPNCHRTQRYCSRCLACEWCLTFLGLVGKGRRPPEMMPCVRASVAGRIEERVDPRIEAWCGCPSLTGLLWTRPRLIPIRPCLCPSAASQQATCTTHTHDDLSAATQHGMVTPGSGLYTTSPHVHKELQRLNPQSRCHFLLDTRDAFAGVSTGLPS